MTCTHLDQIRTVIPRTDGCEECLRTGDGWVHLRLCLTWGMLVVVMTQRISMPPRTFMQPAIRSSNLSSQVRIGVGVTSTTFSLHLKSMKTTHRLKERA